MQGSESSRAAAKYKADRALFLLLLSAPYRLVPNKTVDVPVKQGRRLVAVVTIRRCQDRAAKRAKMYQMNLY